MTGRPSAFSAEIADAICERLIGGESLRTICGDDAMPAASSVFKWLRQHPDFAEQYARAREAQADALVEDIIEIADDGRSDFRVDGQGNERVDAEHIQRSRLRVDTRKWLMAKLAPKKYGDKIDLNHGGAVATLTHEEWLASLK